MATLPTGGDAIVRTNSGLLRRRPVLLFVMVTFVVSYCVGVPALFMVGAWATDLNEVAKLYIGRFFVVIGPTCGALAAISATSGRPGIRSFLRARLSLSAASWAVTIFLPPLALILVLASYALAGSPLGTLAIALRETWQLLLVHIALQVLIIGLCEELGWRGWLLPTLTARYGLSRATLFTGVVWYIWHLPILLGGVNDALWFALAIAGLSLIFSVLWLRSGQSAALPAVAHGSLNAAVVFLTAALPGADHKAAWSVLCGMLAASGVAAFLLTRAEWRETSEAHFLFPPKAVAP